jgi:hypothetical protein
LKGHRFKRCEETYFADAFASGHDFSRADKPFIFVITSGPALRDREGSASMTFSADIQPCR